MKGFMFTVKCFVAVVLLTLCITYPAYALPGDLDTSFGNAGLVTVQGLDDVRGGEVVIQTDGKIILVGSHPQRRFALARLNRNGSLDSTFGIGGIVAVETGQGRGTTPSAVALEADGGIVVVGNVFDSSAFHVVRYSSLDGRVLRVGEIDFSSTLARANAFAIQSDGKIVVVGRTGERFLVVRLNPDLTLDTTFSGDGKVIVSMGIAFAEAKGIAIQADGKIVVVGSATVGTETLFATVRFNPDGSLDLPFGGCCTNGIVFTNAGTQSTEGARAVAIQADGKIVMTGFGTARLNSDGTLDTTFGGDGTIFNGGGGVVIQADGRIVITGGENGLLRVTRILPNGTVDVSFAGDGSAHATFGCVSPATSASLGRSLAIQRSDGRLVAAGHLHCFNPRADSLAVARFHAFECGGKNVTILGTNRDDQITGTEGPDVIHGLGGNDVIDGRGGDDTICGGDGNDILFGGAGSDVLIGGKGSDKLDGGTGIFFIDTCVASSGSLFAGCEIINSGGSGISGTWEDVSQRCRVSHQGLVCRIKGTIAVENPRTETTAIPSVAAFYLSTDEIWDESDTFLTTAEIPVLKGGQIRKVRFNKKLAVGEDPSGQFVIAVLDFFDVIPEANEANNIVVSPALPEAVEHDDGDVDRDVDGGQ